MKNKKKPFSLLYQFAKPHKSGYILSVILATLGVAFGLIPYYCVAKMIIGLMSGIKEISFFLNLCLICGLCFVLKATLSGISTMKSHEATFRVLSEVRRRIALKFTKVPMGFLLNTPSGNLKNSMVERVEQLEIPLAHVVPEITSNTLVPIGIFIYIFVLDWRMALVSLITIPIGFLFYKAQMKDYSKKYNEVVQAGKKMGAVTVEYINGIKVIKTFNQSASSYSKFTDAVHNNANLILNWMKSSQKYTAAMINIWPSVLVGVLPAGCLFYLNKSLSSSVFITIIILSLGIIDPIISAAFFADDVSKISTIMNEISFVLNVKELNHSNVKQNLNNLDINLKNVTFGYKEKKVLNKVNLEFKQGEVNALVGPSGSGKSTIGKLIASFWDVDEGNITIGGVEIKDIPVDQISDMIAYVSQDNYLFNDTIRNNIRMGNIKATDKEVEDIAKASGCHDFIMSLQNGYDTVVGGAGSHLSGGECQRIAIARAMMKDATIVILDEATSYADPENEAVIQEAIEKLTKGKTLIIIAHRLSTIINADKIIVVEKGKIVNCGKHKKLLESCLLYKKMWTAFNNVRDKDFEVIQ